MRSDGSIAAWGWDLRGEISGMPEAEEYFTVSPGYTHTLGLRDDGTIAAWGWERGQFGQISQVPDDEGFFMISAGDYHNLALKR
jgi:alpha-tubulin suppressor-like RCC1 family protein